GGPWLRVDGRFYRGKAGLPKGRKKRSVRPSRELRQQLWTLRRDTHAGADDLIFASARGKRLDPRTSPAASSSPPPAPPAARRSGWQLWWQRALAGGCLAHGLPSMVARSLGACPAQSSEYLDYRRNGETFTPN